MSRHTLISLCIGAGAALIASLAHLLGAFSGLVESLGETYRTHGVFAPGEVHRMVWLEIVVVVASGFGVAWAVVDLPRVSQKSLVILCGVLLVLGLSPSLALHNCLFDSVSPLLAVVLASLGGLVFASTEMGMRKRALDTVMGPRVSDGVFHELMERRDPPAFAGARRDVTVLTCRVLNLDELAEELAPPDHVALSSLFLRSVSSFLLTRGAYVEEAGPESIRGYFGLVESGDDHGARACQAALELRSRLRNLAREAESRWFRTAVFGTGLETGTVTAGAFGWGDQRFYGAAGVCADFSRRLASANRRFGSQAIIGPELYAALDGEFEVRPLEMFYDPERGSLYEIYELLEASNAVSEEVREAKDHFWSGVILMREKRFEEALESFSRARAAVGADPVIERFIGEVQGVLAPGGPRGIDLADENPETGHARPIQRL